MARKDISDYQVCLAYKAYMENDERPLDYLMRTTGEHEKVCWRAMERALNRDLVNFGVGLNVGWLTLKGRELLASSNGNKQK